VLAHGAAGFTHSLPSDGAQGRRLTTRNDDDIAQVELGALAVGGDVVTGGRVVGGRDVVIGGLVLDVSGAGDTEVLGGFPPPPPLVDASAIATTPTIATTVMIATTSSTVPCDLLSSKSSSTRAPQWGQNVAPGVSGSSHSRQRPVALTIRHPVLPDAVTGFSRQDAARAGRTSERDVFGPLVASLSG
jgi:hypothetical protein